MKKIAVVLTIVAILIMTMPAAAGSVAEITSHTKVGNIFTFPRDQATLLIQQTNRSTLHMVGKLPWTDRRSRWPGSICSCS